MAGPGEYPYPPNPRTASISLPEGYVIVIYDEYFFQGNSYVITENQTALPSEPVPFINTVYSYTISQGAWVVVERRRAAGVWRCWECPR